MSKYFVLAEEGIGPGGQIYFRKDNSPYNWYDLYLDDVKIGKIMQHKRGEWIGLSHAEESEFFKVRMVEGFASRMAAASFVIKHHGYHMRDERQQLKRFDEMRRRLSGSV